MFLQLAKLFKLSSLSKIALCYTERCFAKVSETQNFLELHFNLVAKILASSELSVHSELEVFNAANNWLQHNSKERSKFAKQLLLKVRLPLLSDHALKYILNERSPFTEDNKCVDILKETLDSKENLFRNKSSKYYKSRYCSQNKFNILICGGDNNGFKAVSNVTQIDGSYLNNVKVLPSTTNERSDSEAVWLKGEVYVFGGLDDNYHSIKYVEKYSPATKTWNIVADMYDDRETFCSCAFMNKIFIIGGYAYEDGEWTTTNTCLQFNTKDNNWKKVARMSQARDNAACTVFEGRIIISGGRDNNDELNTVESYDVVADEWSSMPNMTGVKSFHSLVVVRNKLFVIGCARDRSEIFENISKKFVGLKSPPVTFVDVNKAISIGSKIFVFQEYNASVLCYNVDTNEWSEESCEVTKNLQKYSCVKFPCF